MISSVHDILSFPCQIEGVLAAAICPQVNRRFLQAFLFINDREQASLISAQFRRVKQINIGEPLLTHITLSNPSMGESPNDCYLEFTINPLKFPSYAHIFTVISRSILHLSGTPIGEMKEISIQEMHTCQVQVPLNPL